MADHPRVAYTLVQSWHRVPGGTAVAALRLADALAATGELDLVGVGPWGRRPPPSPWATSTVPVRRLPLPYPLLYEMWQRFDRLAPQRVTGPVDLVHATAPTVPPTGGAPLVVTIHDVFPLTDPDRFTPRGVRVLTAGLDRARDRAALVLCPSQATADGCIAHGFAVDRIRVTPWGVTSTPVDASAVEAALRRHGLDRPYLLWAGTVEPRKNLATLLAAFGALAPRRPQLDLVLVGPDGWNEQLEPLVSGLGDRVRRLGFVSRADLDALEAGALAFCFPSLREGFGLPVLEAMAQGVPVVASSDPAVGEVVGDAAVVVDALDVDGWIAALDRLVDDPDLRRRLAVAGPARAAGFTWERAARLTLDGYREVLT